MNNFYMINLKYAVYRILLKQNADKKCTPKQLGKKKKNHLSKNWVTYAHSSTNQVEEVRIFVSYIFGQR